MLIESERGLVCILYSSYVIVTVYKLQLCSLREKVSMLFIQFVRRSYNIYVVWLCIVSLYCTLPIGRPSSNDIHTLCVVFNSVVFYRVGHCCTEGEGPGEERVPSEGALPWRGVLWTKGTKCTPCNHHATHTHTHNTHTHMHTHTQHARAHTHTTLTHSHTHNTHMYTHTRAHTHTCTE